MKVGSRGAVDAYVRTSQVQVGATRPTPPVASGAGGGAARTSEATHVTISEEARAMIAGATPPVDRAKVDALRTKIADGTFQVDAKAVAERLLDKIG